MPTPDYYKRKAARLTKELDDAKQSIGDLCATITMLQNLRIATPILTNITRDGRRIKFTFMRNWQLTTIETLGTWSDDVEGWRKALLDTEGQTDG